MSVTYTVRVEQEDGGWWAEVVDLPGCFASGEDLDELRRALEEAIGLYLSGSGRAKVVRILEFGAVESNHSKVLVTA